MPGLIERYRERLPFAPEDPVVSLGEGSTPLVHAPGLSERVDIRVGPALDSLLTLRDEGVEPFDLIFIDADKQSSPEYFALALELSHPGTVIITDNVIRDGALIDPASDDPSVEGARRLHELLAREKRVSATTIQTVGSKGYDGFTLALVKRK